MKEESNNCNKNYNHLLESLCNILKERSNEECYASLNIVKIG